MFGFDFLMEKEGKREAEEEEETSEFFSFHHPAAKSDEGSVSQENLNSFNLNFKIEGLGDNPAAAPPPLSYLFEKKPEVENIPIMMIDNEEVVVKMEVESPKSENQYNPDSTANDKTISKPLSPWKIPLQISVDEVNQNRSFESNVRENLVQPSSISTNAPEPVVVPLPPVVPKTSRYLVTPNAKVPERDENDKERGVEEITVSTCELKDASSPAVVSSKVRRNLFAGATPRKCPEIIELAETPMTENNNIGGNPSEFVSFLRNQFGSTEEFAQFERYFYGQVEEVRMLRGNVEGLRSLLVKTQEQKRVLELQLVSEKALRDQESKNALMDLEKNNMQLNTQIYSMKCEVESWKRKAEATLKESGWLKQQLKSLELEKTEAVRKLGELSQQHNGVEQYRISIEAYARRQREAMTDIQKRLIDLEKAKETLTTLTDYNQKQMNFMAVHLRNRENNRLTAEKRVGSLEEDLIKTRAELVQNNAKLTRAQVCETKTADIMGKIMNENKDLHCGINLLVSTIQNVGTVNLNFLDGIEQVHEEVEESVKKLRIDESCP